MVSKYDYKACTSDFESQWVPHSYGLVPYISKILSKLLQAQISINYSLLDIFGLVWFYYISTIVDNLMPNPVYTYILNI